MNPTAFHDLHASVAVVPAGAWGVAVSGGADSVALLRLLHDSGDLQLRIVHLNHQTRGADSDDDERFVASLGKALKVPCSIARRDDIERSMSKSDLPANKSARYRAIRLELYRRAVEEHRLSGVILAHHADDQAETVLQRLVRGAGYLPLAGISPDARVRGVRLLRPLLGVRRRVLREYLTSVGQPWREDASNASDAYQRNRVRRALAASPEALTASLLELGDACRGLRNWAESAAPVLGDGFRVVELQQLPPLLAETSARRWLARCGVAREELSDTVTRQLVLMAADAASPSRRQFPGNVLVRRKAGWISRS